MQLHTAATVSIDKPIEEVFDFAVDVANMPRLMQPLPPIPGVAGSELIDARELRTGVKRRVTMTDGSTVLEEVLDLTRPHRHRYRWLDKPAFPFSLLVRGAEARWTFAERAGQTAVEWHYSFELTSFLAYPAAQLVVLAMRRWMAQALGSLRDNLGAP
jgi:uncharacterized protein YndB with AHSA1/START domain